MRTWFKDYAGVSLWTSCRGPLLMRQQRASSTQARVIHTTLPSKALRSRSFTFLQWLMDVTSLVRHKVCVGQSLSRSASRPWPNSPCRVPCFFLGTLTRPLQKQESLPKVQMHATQPLCTFLMNQSAGKQMQWPFKSHHICCREFVAENPKLSSTSNCDSSTETMMVVGPNNKHVFIVNPLISKIHRRFGKCVPASDSRAKKKMTVSSESTSQPATLKN